MSDGLRDVPGPGPAWVRVVRAVTPPILLRVLSRLLRSRGPSEWEYRPSGWDASSSLRGWDEASVAETQARRWDALADSLAGTAAFSFNPEGREPGAADVGMHNTLVSFAYVVALAARRTDRLRILDWGGGIGQYSLVARAAVPDVELDYHVVDVPSACRSGAALTTEVTFHPTGSDDWRAGRYDLVVSSSSLQYVRDWEETLGLLAGLTEDLLYVTRLPLVTAVPSFVVVQRPYRHGYDTEYQGWFINRGELLRAAERSDVRPLREFLIDERPDVPHAPEAARYAGLLFRADEQTKEQP